MNRSSLGVVFALFALILASLTIFRMETAILFTTPFPTYFSIAAFCATIWILRGINPVRRRRVIDYAAMFLFAVMTGHAIAEFGRFWMVVYA